MSSNGDGKLTGNIEHWLDLTSSKETFNDQQLQFLPSPSLSSPPSSMSHQDPFPVTLHSLNLSSLQPASRKRPNDSNVDQYTSSETGIQSNSNNKREKTNESSHFVTQQSEGTKFVSSLIPILQQACVIDFLVSSLGISIETYYNAISTLSEQIPQNSTKRTPPPCTCLGNILSTSHTTTTSLPQSSSLPSLPPSPISPNVSLSSSPLSLPLSHHLSSLSHPPSSSSLSQNSDFASELHNGVGCCYRAFYPPASKQEQEIGTKGEKEKAKDKKDEENCYRTLTTKSHPIVQQINYTPSEPFLEFAKTEFKKIGRFVSEADYEFLSYKTESWVKETVSKLRISPAVEFVSRQFTSESEIGAESKQQRPATWLIWGFISRGKAEMKILKTHQAVLRFSESRPGEIILTSGTMHAIVKWTTEGGGEEGRRGRNGEVGLFYGLNGQDQVVGKYRNILDMFAKLGITELYGGEVRFVKIPQNRK